MAVGGERAHAQLYRLRGRKEKTQSSKQNVNILMTFAVEGEPDCTIRGNSVKIY